MVDELKTRNEQILAAFRTALQTEGDETVLCSRTSKLVEDFKVLQNEHNVQTSELEQVKLLVSASKQQAADLVTWKENTIINIRSVT